MPVYLKYFQAKQNAGDQFSLLVAKHYFSNEIIGCNEEAVGKPNIMLLGSILHWADPQTYICGAGFINTENLLNIPPAYVSCVRGPLSANNLSKIMDIPGLCYGDPGILAPKFFPQLKPTNKAIGIIPHYVDAGLPWIKKCRESGVEIIDVTAPLDIFFEQLQNCEVILSSSLHGIIFAHSYNKPALWIELSDRVIGNGFKFYDYYLSIGHSAEKMNRIKIEGHENPFELAKLAKTGSHTNLIEGLENALQKTLLAISTLGKP